MEKNKNKIVLVTGANKGMGFATCEKLAAQGHHVIMVGRNETELKRAFEKLLNKKYSLDFFVADISQKVSTDNLINFVIEKYKYVDVLINNAGVYSLENIFTSDELILENTMNTNTFGPHRLMKKIIPLMLKNGYGRIVNVSSGLGALEGASANYFSYSLSKSSLNMLTLLYAQEVQGTDVKINAVCPGWVKTDMGGSGAPRSIEEGIKGIIWAATLDQKGPNGGFFRDGKKINW
jgi:NAD(P)-dependent dehydrogenase (short-subunit alcohol dehydrogenase family)